MRDRRVVLFTIYENPVDHPGAYVVRRSWVGPQGEETDPNPYAITASLAGARQSLPPFLYRMERHPLDGPEIVEVWL